MLDSAAPLLLLLEMLLGARLLAVEWAGRVWRRGSGRRRGAWRSCMADT